METKKGSAENILQCLPASAEEGGDSTPQSDRHVATRTSPFGIPPLCILATDHSRQLCTSVWDVAALCKMPGHRDSSGTQPGSHCVQGLPPTPVGHLHLHVKLTFAVFTERGRQSNWSQGKGKQTSSGSRSPLGRLTPSVLTGDRKLQRFRGEDPTCLRRPTYSISHCKNGGRLVKPASVSSNWLPCPSLKTVASPSCSCLTGSPPLAAWLDTGALHRTRPGNKTLRRKTPATQ